MKTLAKNTNKIAVLLLAMIISLFIGSTITQVESHALFPSNGDISIANNGAVSTKTNNTNDAFWKSY